MNLIRIILATFVIMLVGCVSTGHQRVDLAVFRLSRDISWTSKPLGFEETIYFGSGIYTSTQRDAEGYYLFSESGTIKVQPKGKDPVYVRGGVYLPDDASKGINVFTVIGSSLVRKREWGPTEFVYHFERK